MKTKFGLSGILLLVLAALPLHAQVAPYEEYGKNLRAAQEVTPLKSDLFGDKVSLYNGATEFDVTDIDLPGNSSLPVRFGRRLMIDDRRLPTGHLGGFGDALGPLGGWDIEVPYIDGVFTAENGWMVIGPNQSATDARCSVVATPYTQVPAGSHNQEPAYLIWDGNQLHIPGEVDEELFQNAAPKLPAVSDGKTYPWVTKSFYRATCVSGITVGASGEAFIVVSPSGMRYTFNRYLVHAMSSILYQAPNPRGGTFKNGADRSHIFLLATRVEDRFGNWVNYTYNSAVQLTSIRASDGREIDVTWTGGVVTSAAAGSRTWHYAYGLNGTLSSVTKPDGSAWTYAIVSGSLKTIRAKPDREPPPQYHCQIDPEPNTGSLVYRITSPSGAQGTFSFEYQRHFHSRVPLTCTGAKSNTNYPQEFDFFDNYTLQSKQITGAGLATQKWTYAYGSKNGGYMTASGSYNFFADPYIPPSSEPLVPPRVVTVTDPSGVTKYSFGVNYGVDEGRLFQTEIDTLGGTAVKVSANAYFSESDIPNQPFPGSVGKMVQPNFKHPMGNRIRPVVATATVQAGDTYTRLNLAFDAFAQPTQVKRYSNIAGQAAVTEQTTYYNDLQHWVIGLPQQVDNLSTGETESHNTYDPNTALLSASSRFGEPLLTYTYDTAGHLASFTDDNAHTTKLGNYYRGIPRLISYPDGTSQSASVDAYAEITAVTDHAGHTTSYAYDPSGWPKEIDYPTGDEAAWLPRTFQFTYVTAAERGIAGGHWRRTVSTGNDVAVTYFDAMLRPLLTDASITGTAGSDITSGSSYDWRGLATFASYPVAGAPDLSALTKGTHTSYDTLGRPLQAQQDSELGALTSTTAYLSGAAVRVTDPRGKVTTTHYQVFDELSTSAPIKIEAPEGITQAIARDLYGNPVSITQSGLYNGSETDSVTKTLIYDSYHRLCRTTEPESGSAVMTYDAANNVQSTAAGLSIGGTACGTAPAGVQTTFTYDPMNRVKTVLPPAGTQSTSYHYTPTGNMDQAVSGNSTWTAHYNFRDMLTAETLTLTSKDPWSVAYAHDAYGNLAQLTFPDGKGVAYVPDARGRPTRAGTYVSAIAYFPNGQVKQFVYGNGTAYLAAQNGRQLLSNFSYGHATTLNVSEDMGYDANGNILTVRDLVDGQRSKTFQYDGLNRLTSAVAPALWGTEQYTYDPLNNLRTRLTAGQTSVYNYGPANLLASISRAGITTSSFGYDNRGNETRRNGVTLQFDQKNQLLQIPAFDSYQYDAAGRRTLKTSANGGASTYTFYDHAGQLLYQLEPAIGKSTDFIYLGTKLIAKDVSLKLSAPGAITFDANPNNGSFKVSWGAVSGATGYTLQESSNRGTKWVTVSSGSGISATLSGRVGGSFVYQVQACTSTICGPWTTSATLGVRPTLPTITVPSGTINGTYTVSWAAPTSANAYTVQESLNGGAWATIASSTTATSIGRPGTTSGSYTYHVAAYNTYGTRGWATSAAVHVDTTYGVLPKAPASFSVPAASNNGSAALSWSAATLATNYAVQQSATGGTSWAAVYSGSATTKTVAGLGNGHYIYRLQACNTYGCSAWVAGNATLVVTLPPTAAPTLTSPPSSTNGSFAVSWSVIAGAVSYTLQQQINGGGWTNLQSGAPTSWSASGYGSASYGYRVQGCNVGGCGPWSNTSVTTVLLPPPTPAGISVPANSSGPIAISWSASPTATIYGLDQSINGGAWSQVYANAGTSTTVQAGATGSYSYRAYACNATGCSGYVVSNPVSVIIVVPIAINGQSYGASYGILSGHTNATAIGFQISGGSTWSVFKITPVGIASPVGLASGPVPAGASTVRYTWTDAGVPGGDSDALGSVSNGAASPVAIGSNPTSQYTTGIFGARTVIRSHSYQLEVDFFNAGGSLLSTSTCTMTAGVAGTY